MSAFANSDGGELYLGVDDNQAARTRSWRGFDNREAANAHIQAFEAPFPLGSDFKYEFLQSEGQSGLVLHITILKTAGVQFASDGKAYVRRGAQALPVTSPDDLDRVRRVKGIVSFESETL